MVERVLHNLLTFLSSLRAPISKVLLVSVAGGEEATCGKTAEALAGVMLCAQHEYPTIQFCALTLDGGSVGNAAAILAAELASANVEAEVLYNAAGARCVRRYQTLPHSQEEEGAMLQDGAYIVTGGLGGLGLQAAKVLAKQGAQNIFLVSRSGKIAYEGQGLEDDLRWLQSESAAQVHIVKCDVSDEAAVVNMLQSVRQTAGSITGVIHCAGVIRDGLLRGGNAATGCAEVWSAKAMSAWWLHKHRISDDISVRIYLSSVTAAIGNAGQTAYGAANRFLDALAEHDRAAGKRAVSLRLPAVADVGMAADLLKKQAADVNAADWSISAADFRELLQRALTTDSEAVITVLPSGYTATMPASVKLQYQQVLGYTAPTQASKPATAAVNSSRPVLSAEEVAQIVRSNICALADTDAVADDCILLESGFDSLSGLDLVQRLSRALNITVPVTLLYDYPTPAAILAYVKGLTSATAGSLALPAKEDRIVDTKTPVFASYFPDSAAPISRVVLFPAMGQPTTSWHDIALRFKRSNVEVHIARFPGMLICTGNYNLVVSLLTIQSFLKC
jgi:enoyl-[acyl-carrier-protein] reductase (NADH)/acyl carrier protein